jgi:hypothetical protein
MDFFVFRMFEKFTLRTSYVTAFRKLTLLSQTKVSVLSIQVEHLRLIKHLQSKSIVLAKCPKPIPLEFQLFSYKTPLLITPSSLL